MPPDPVAGNGGPPSGAVDKGALRARMLAWRASLAREEAARRSTAVAMHVLAWSAWREARAVLIYLATPREVQTSAFVAAGKVVAAPGLDGVVRRLMAPDAVRRSLRGVPEPDPERCPAFNVAELELALIPGVAFDRAGGRLGRGAGFYDRLLALLDCPTCGLAFDAQVVPRVPTDPWDVRLGFLASEQGVLPCRSGGS